MFNVTGCTKPKLSLYDSVKLVNGEDWNTITCNQSIYLSLDYLQALEDALPEGIGFRYIIYYNDLLKPIAVSYIQIIEFEISDAKFDRYFSKVPKGIKTKVLQSINANIVLCGNVFACGEVGYAHTSDLSTSDALQLISGSLKRIIDNKNKNGSISFSLFKEFWPTTFVSAQSLVDDGYKEIMLDVNMVMPIPEHWKHFDDYLGVLLAKYRTRTKSVYKKSHNIKVVDFTAKDIENNADRIEELYYAVLDNALYKFGQLNSKAFVNFKKKLGDQFIFKAYYLKEKMIGFSTIIHFNNITDANYVGLDYAYNKAYALYQRMLYDFIKTSITLGSHELRLGRTAELIKSAVGAKVVDMKLYVKHRSKISNKLLEPIIKNISPSEVEIRNPFKSI